MRQYEPDALNGDPPSDRILSHLNLLILLDCSICLLPGIPVADALTGNYSFFLFDLKSDPYETTNLYYSSDDDTAQDALVSEIVRMSK